MQSLLDGCKGLTGVDVGAGGDPDGVQGWQLDHVLVGVEDLDAGALVCLLGPLHFIVPGAADGDDFGTGDSPDQRVDVTLAHAAEASHGNVQGLVGGEDRAHCFFSRE